MNIFGMHPLQKGGISECSQAVTKGSWESEGSGRAKDLLYATTRTVHLSRHHNVINQTKSAGEMFVVT